MCDVARSKRETTRGGDLCPHALPTHAGGQRHTKQGTPLSLLVSLWSVDVLKKVCYRILYSVQLYIISSQLGLLQHKLSHFGLCVYVYVVNPDFLLPHFKITLQLYSVVVW